MFIEYIYSKQLPMSIQLTHPRIIHFFESNKHINPEDIQLQIIDLLEKNTVLTSTQQVQTGKEGGLWQTAYQINELRTTISRFNETIGIINKQIMDTFINVKTQYVQEYNSITGDYDGQRQSIINNHHQFTAKMQSAIFSIIHEPTLKTKYPSLHEKIQQLTRQFIRIMENNMLTSMSAPTKYKQEYLTNFETNAAHMVQSMQSIFTDFAASKESACNTIITALSTGSEGSSISFSRIQYELTDFIQVVASVNTSNVFSIEQIIHRAFPTASNIYTEDCASINQSSVVICRYGVPDIRVMSYTHKDRNVNADEIRADLKICQQAECNGIVVSQHTGISGKPNYHIDIQNHHVIIYIHCAQYSPDKIQLAVDMIDSIYQKLSEIKISPEYRESIPKETLDDINREYQQFIVQKETFSQLVKDTHRKMTAQLDDLRFPSLDRFLGTRYSSCKKQGYTCDLCGSFNVPTLKGLAAHKRGCQRKLGTCKQELI